MMLLYYCVELRYISNSLSLFISIRLEQAVSMKTGQYNHECRNCCKAVVLGYIYKG